MHSDTVDYPSLDGIYGLTSYLGDKRWRTLLWVKGVRIHLGDFEHYDDSFWLKRNTWSAADVELTYYLALLQMAS
jgi:hypothetical protein